MFRFDIESNHKVMNSFRFDIESERNGKPKIEKLYSFKQKLWEIAHGFKTFKSYFITLKTYLLFFTIHFERFFKAHQQVFGFEFQRFAFLVSKTFRFLLFTLKYVSFRFAFVIFTLFANEMAFILLSITAMSE
jgi:hypothetical protein